MAKKGRNMKGYLKGNIDELLQLGTLGATTLISTDFDESPEEKTFISSIVATYALDGLVAGQGPILFGIAHSDYTSAEIEAVIENTGSWDAGSKVEQEVAKRLVRIIGTFVGKQGTGTNDVQFNDGVPVKTKLNWTLNTGDTLKMWAYNISGAALSTADPGMRMNGHANLWQ